MRTTAGFTLLTAAIVATTSVGFASTAAADPATLQGRVDAATADANSRGAQVEIAFLDRMTMQYVDNGPAAHRPTETASVVKVFIADDILNRESKGEFKLSNADRDELALMLRSSDDNAASDFWSRFGGNRIVDNVAARYHLGETHPPADTWYDTMLSAADMVKYYAGLSAGQGGVFGAQRDFLLNALRASTQLGTDGYDQTFGLPAGLPRESVRGVKQGWMISHQGNWVHNSSVIAGPAGRYVVAVFALEPSGSGDPHARDTINRAVNIMFPRGAAQSDVPDILGGDGPPGVQQIINGGENLLSHGAFQ